MSCIYVLPERNLGVAVLINSQDYLVAQGMMDSIDWSVTLMLLGMQPVFGVLRLFCHVETEIIFVTLNKPVLFRLF